MDHTTSRKKIKTRSNDNDCNICLHLRMLIHLQYNGSVGHVLRVGFSSVLCQIETHHQPGIEASCGV